jgi:diguanylate cyclase (GGDEF)-like protein
VPLTTAVRFDELKAANQLPSPTGVALAILRLAESEKTTAREIAHVLQTDPALSGRVLKVANSASSGRGRPVASVREAVSHLGIRQVRNVALGFSLVSQGGTGACRGFDYGRFWSRSLAQGVAAQALACHTGQVPPAQAFTCGLLAQVGRLALASIHPDDYSRVLDAVGEPEADLCRRERDHFATDHNELSAALLLDWGLPEVCVLAVRHHEHADQSGLARGERAQVLARLLAAAACMAAVCVATDEGRAARVLDLFAAREDVGIAPGELIELCDRVVAEWQDWGQILQVDTRAVPPFAELAQRARRAGGPGSPEGPPPEAPAATPLSVVVVDDDPIQLRLLAAHLTGAGHTVHTAADGESALRLALEVNPQLVLTDWRMPGMDGTGLVKALRRTKMGRQLYILMLTGSEEDDTQVKAFEAGADDYVLKPVRPKLLAARLRACARVLHLQDEVRRDKEELRRCMTELAVANRKLQEAARTDPLTGLYNRRYALERLDQEWARASRGDLPLACVILDIDHFKRVNDTLGHDAGDLVLSRTAGVLRGALRDSDVVCRLGGEEFLVLGTGMDREAGHACAERLRAALDDQTIEAPGGAVRVTLSAGVAVRAAHMRGPADLLKAADQAVYAAKQGGRNRVCLADEPAPPAGTP